MKRVFILMTFLVGIYACNSDTIYKSEAALPEAGWVRTSPVSYDFDIQDTTTFYEMMLDVKANENYRYQNLYVNIETRMAKQKKILFRSNWAHPEENGTESALPALALYLSNCNRGLNFHKKAITRSASINLQG